MRTTTAEDEAVAAKGRSAFGLCKGISPEIKGSLGFVIQFFVSEPGAHRGHTAPPPFPLPVLLCFRGVVELVVIALVTQRRFPLGTEIEFLLELLIEPDGKTRTFGGDCSSRVG